MKRLIALSALLISTLGAHTANDELFTLYTFTNLNYCYKVITKPYSWFVRNSVSVLEEGNVESGALRGFWLLPADAPPPCVE